ncbi:ankyrin repeat protein [Eptesipox virus]|nr:ankyrin repeat protein [Eptesipox virus]
MEQSMTFDNVITNRNIVMSKIDEYAHIYPLHACIFYKESMRVAKHIITKQNRGINTATNFNNITALHYAVYCNNFEMVKFLIEECGENINNVDSENYNAIAYAFFGKGYENVELLEYLIKKGINMDSCNLLLHMVVNTKNDTSFLVEFLVKHGACVNCKNLYGVSPIMLATYNGNITLVKLLIKLGANINDVDVNGNTLFHMLRLHPTTINLVKLFLEKGLDINAQNKNGDTPLHVLCSKTLLNTHVKFYIDNGANVNAQNKNGDTPLHVYFKSNTNKNIFKNIIKVFTDSNIDLSIVNTNNQSALTQYIIDARMASLNIIEMLCKKEFDVNYKYGLGKIPMLSILIHKCLYDSVKFWLSKYPDTINVQDDDGNYPIHYAALHFKSNILILFIDLKNDINVTNNIGETPLHLAVYYNNIKNVQLLLNHGARCTTTNDGHSVLMYAAKSVCGTPLQNFKNLFNEDMSAVTESGYSTFAYVALNDLELVEYIISLNPTLETMLISTETVYKNIKMCTRMKSVLRYVLLYYPEFYTLFTPYKTDIECTKYIDKCNKELNNMKQIQVTNDYTLYDIVRNKYTNTCDKIVTTFDSFDEYNFIIKRAIARYRYNK